MIEDALSQAWARTVARMLTESTVGPADVGILEDATPLGAIANNMLLAVSSAYAKSRLEKSLRLLEAILTEEVGQPMKVAISVNDGPQDDTPPTPALHVVPDPVAEAGTPTPQPAISAAPAPHIPTPAAPHPGPTETAATPPTATHERTPHQPTLGQAPQTPPAPPAPTTPTATVDAETHLNPNYTFSTFVIGSSNRFATAAATAAAENPGGSYNPLFIFGGSGLGKTHLLHAIGHEVLSLRPNLKVKYVSSEEFTNDFINSIASGRALEFQNRYRAVDTLLVDDIQFLQGKEQTIEEFFHTFNALHNQGSQIVITSDMPPKRLGGFEERMRSRFEWGLQVDIQPADLETRIAILQKKAEQECVQVDLPVLEYIAERFSTNIRELEGALVRVTAFASLSSQPITADLAAVVLKDNVSDSPMTEITASLIQQQTADYFNVTIEALCSSSRSRSLTEARQIAMYLCRELTDLSLPAIGQAFGGRDHTTVIHANRKITENMSSKPQVYTDVTELTSRIRAAARAK